MLIPKYFIPPFLILLAISCADKPGTQDTASSSSKETIQQGQEVPQGTNQDQSSSQNTEQNQSSSQQGQSSSQDTAQSAPPTYSKDVKPIIDSNCISCHGSSSQYPLDSYQKIVNGQTGCGQVNEKRYVVPSNAQVSYLYKKLTAAQDICGSKMPPGYYLSQDKIDTIKKWIDAGAPE